MVETYLFLLTVDASPANVALTNAVQTVAVSRTAVLAVAHTLPIQTSLGTHARTDGNMVNTSQRLTAITSRDRSRAVCEGTRADGFVASIAAESWRTRGVTLRAFTTSTQRRPIRSALHITPIE